MRRISNIYFALLLCVVCIILAAGCDSSSDSSQLKVVEMTDPAGGGGNSASLTCREAADDHHDFVIWATSEYYLYDSSIDASFHDIVAMLSDLYDLVDAVNLIGDYPQLSYDAASAAVLDIFPTEDHLLATTPQGYIQYSKDRLQQAALEGNIEQYVADQILSIWTTWETAYQAEGDSYDPSQLQGDIDALVAYADASDSVSTIGSVGIFLDGYETYMMSPDKSPEGYWKAFSVGALDLAVSAVASNFAGFIASSVLAAVFEFGIEILMLPDWYVEAYWNDAPDYPHWGNHHK